MVVHAAAVLIIVLGVVAGVIVGVSTGSIGTGVVIAAAGFGIGTVIGILNMIRIWRNPGKIMPKNW